MFPVRAGMVFEEAMWPRPRTDSIIVRDVATARYRKGERVSSHVDGSYLTVLIYLQEPAEGDESVFENARLSFAPVQLQVLLYESKRGLTHHAPQVQGGEKWMLQLLIYHRVGQDDVDF